MLNTLPWESLSPYTIIPRNPWLYGCSSSKSYFNALHYRFEPSDLPMFLNIVIFVLQYGGSHLYSCDSVKLHLPRLLGLMFAKLPIEPKDLLEFEEQQSIFWHVVPPLHELLCKITLQVRSVPFKWISYSTHYQFLYISWTCEWSEPKECKWVEIIVVILRGVESIKSS